MQVQNLSKQKLYPLLKPYISLVSQLAKKFEKEINPLKIIGDKDLIIDERMKPFIKSLIHVFRNSVDHGIETEEERLEKNKEETGTIRCEFKEQNNNLIIKISDDGAGIDKEKLKERLQENGLDTRGISDKDLFNTIFYENISTKNTIDEISGRGMGMSAVKNELDTLNGQVEVHSQKDNGTYFEFTLPLK